MRILILVGIAVVIGAVIGLARRKTRESGDATPELHKHPERLNQSLDPTDDA